MWSAMNAVLPYFFGFAAFATLLVLVIGVVSFAVHGRFYQRHANNLMRARVLFQGIALALLAAILYSAMN